MGVKSGLTEAFVVDAQTCKQIIAANPKSREIIKPFLNGRDTFAMHLNQKKFI